MKITKCKIAFGLSLIALAGLAIATAVERRSILKFFLNGNTSPSYFAGKDSTADQAPSSTPPSSLTTTSNRLKENMTLFNESMIQNSSMPSLLSSPVSVFKRSPHDHDDSHRSDKMNTEAPDSDSDDDGDDPDDDVLPKPRNSFAMNKQNGSGSISNKSDAIVVQDLIEFGILRLTPDGTNLSTSGFNNTFISTLLSMPVPLGLFPIFANLSANRRFRRAPTNRTIIVPTGSVTISNGSAVSGAQAAANAAQSLIIDILIGRDGLDNSTAMVVNASEISPNGTRPIAVRPKYNHGFRPYAVMRPVYRPQVNQHAMPLPPYAANQQKPQSKKNPDC